jgi:hypothetical protein
MLKHLPKLSTTYYYYCAGAQGDCRGSRTVLWPSSNQEEKRINKHRVPHHLLFLMYWGTTHTHRHLTQTQTVVDSARQTDPTYLHNRLSTLYCSLSLAFLPCPVARVAAQASLTANLAISYPVPLLPVDEMRWLTPYAGLNFSNLTRGHGTANRRGV